MPVRNETKHILLTMQTLLNQSYAAGRFEILVADGMSDDGTREQVAALAKSDTRVHLIDNPGRIMASGFNTAIAKARGQYILMMGGHTELADNYVEACIRAFQIEKVDCVGGLVLAQGDTKKAATIAVAMQSVFGVGGVSFRVGSRHQKYVDTVAFGMYAREVFERIGVLDAELIRNQDDEFNYRLRAAGGRILLIPETSARYRSRATLARLWLQYLQYGYWKVRVLQKHPLQMKPRQFVPGAFVGVLLVSLLLAGFVPSGGVLLAFVGGSYITANLVATLWTAAKNGWQHLLLLPLVFAILHFSYGLGFLAGLVRFWNRWGDSSRPAPLQASVQPWEPGSWGKL